jgi:hypothetical protein
MEVVANPRYEKPRAPWTGYKRPTHALNGRNVHPRLVHEHPTDDISGLGRRKIPTSSQKPDRKSNVGIRYTRVIDTTAASLSTGVNVGDLLFVGKKSTLFGTGVNRVSAVLSLNQINEILDKDTCILKKPPDDDISKFWEVKRRQASEESRTAVRDFLESRKLGKTTSDESVADIQQLHSKFYCFDASSYYSNFTPELYPMLPQIEEWSLDGVLVSRDDDTTVSAQLIPSIQDSQTILSVGVGGPCEVRNMLHSSSPQFFGESIDSQDDLFVNLVSSWNGVGFKYRYYVTSRTRMLNIMESMKESTSREELGIDELFSTVAAYRIGKVMDTNSVRYGEKKVTVSVAIVNMDFYDLWKYLTSGDPLSEWKARHTRLQDKRAKQRWVQEKLARVRRMVTPPTTIVQRVRNRIPLMYFAQFLGLATNNLIRMMNASYRMVLIPQPQNVTGNLLLAPREEEESLIDQADAAVEAAGEDDSLDDAEEIDTDNMAVETDQPRRKAGAPVITIEQARNVRKTLRAIERMYSEAQTDEIKLFLERLLNLGLSSRPLIETVRERASARARLPLEFKLRPIMTSSRDGMMYAFAAQISSAVRERRLTLQTPQPLTIEWMNRTMVVRFQSGLRSDVPRLPAQLPPSKPPSRIPRDVPRLPAQLPPSSPPIAPSSGIPLMPSNLTALTALVTKAMYDVRTLNPEAIQRIPMANDMMISNGIYTSMQEVITNVIDDNDFDSVCGTFDSTQDNGLKRELCLLLAQSGRFGKPQTNNGMVFFELTDAQKSANVLEIKADLTSAYDLITGTLTPDETNEVMSNALNFLFRMEFTTPWTPSVFGGRWRRTLKDSATFMDVASAVKFLGNAVYNTASSIAVLASDVAPIILSALVTKSNMLDSGMSQQSLAVMSTEVLQDPQGMQLITQFTTPSNIRQSSEERNVFTTNAAYQVADLFKTYRGPEITLSVLEFISEYKPPSNPDKLRLPSVPQEFKPYPVPGRILNSPMYTTYEIPPKLALPAPPSASPSPPSTSLEPNASIPVPRPVPSPSAGSSSGTSAPRPVTKPKEFGEKLYDILRTTNNTSPEEIVKRVKIAVEGHTVDELQSEIPKIDHEGVRDLVKERVSVLTYDEAAAEQSRVSYSLAGGVLSLVKKGLEKGLEKGIDLGGRFVMWNLEE